MGNNIQTSNQLPTVDLDQFKEGIQNKISFIASLEENLFDWEKVKNECTITKMEYYKLAKSSLISDLNFIKTLPLGSDDEMLKNILISLNKKQKNKLKKIILQLINEKEINDSDIEE